MRESRLPYDISIIIVSYNCSDLLMLALAAVRRSVEGVKAEVIVVDNASQDDTLERVRVETPWVKLINMGRNAGFSAANNAGMEQSLGRIILILNPDTILTRDTVRDIIAHFDTHPGCGALGIRMVNGEGRFLGESKRGYTTISASIFKLTGLWKMAPKNKKINAYYIGDCPETGVCHAPILSGACMSFNHDLMELVGTFDDTYFMYCEDNDLSWRMDQTSTDGNCYRGDIPIVHFKGQSTPRDKKYIGYFYDSMLTFAAKFEFPRHNSFVNRLIAIGIRVAYCVARVRGEILKNMESKIYFATPTDVLFVTADGKTTDRGWETINSTELSKVVATDYDAIVFDIDGDMKANIEFMRANELKTMFGFYNPDNGNTLVFFNNRCHRI